MIFEESEKNLELSVAGSLDLQIGGFVSLEGGFSVKKFVEDPDGDEKTTKLVVGASVSGYFGENRGTSNAIGVQINDASLGLVLYRTTGSADEDKNGSSYALHATSGAVELVGVEGLTLSGLLAVRVNNSHRTVKERIEVPGLDAPIEVEFTSDAEIKTVGGALKLGIGDFTLGGAFSFETQRSGTTTTLLVAVGMSRRLSVSVTAATGWD